MTKRKEDKIKEFVKGQYNEIWSRAESCEVSDSEGENSSCGCGCNGNEVEVKTKSAHEELLEELDLKPGMRILDVGSGSGKTILSIAEQVGPNGKAVGVDFSEVAVKSARKKAAELGLDKITEFKLGEAEKIPYDDETFDTVISECVVCLVPDKENAIKEKARVLKPGGKIVMHDVIAWTDLPKVMREDPEMFSGCIGGTVPIEEYKMLLGKVGLTDIKVVDHTKNEKAKLSASIISAAMKIRDRKKFLEVVDFVRNDGIGYALFVAKKPY